jgi:SH3-like domain-containing protein
MAILTGSVLLREGPSQESARLSVLVKRGTPIEILAVHGAWYRVRWRVPDEVDATGWVHADWVGLIEPVPTSMITPDASTTPLTPETTS